MTIGGVLLARVNNRRVVVEALAALPDFSDLEPDLLDSLAGEVLFRRFEADQVVFLEGESSSGLFVVDQGWLKAVKIAESGREQVMRILGPGETFSELSLFVATPSPATVVALEASSLWLVPREAALAMMEEHPPLMRALTQTLARRVLYLLNLVEDLSLRTVEARLARYLLEHAVDDVVHRRRWHTQAELAAQLGTVPDVLGRALSNLSESALVRVERRRILILNRSGLTAKAELSR